MTSAAAWLERSSAAAPPALRDRAARYLEAAAPDPDPATHLAAAGLAALEATLRSAGERPAALDLLAADALVTLALLVKARTDPGQLASFAARIRAEGAVV